MKSVLYTVALAVSAVSVWDAPANPLWNARTASVGPLQRVPHVPSRGASRLIAHQLTHVVDPIQDPGRSPQGVTLDRGIRGASNDESSLGEIVFGIV
jgi:hypothetical protein